MTTLTAQPGMLMAHEIRIGQGAAKLIEQMRAYPKRVKPKRGRSTVPQVSLPKEMREPTPQRVEKAAGTRRADAPPFNTQIVSPHQKFLKQLGRDTVNILDRFVELADSANRTPRMTAKYDGITVDSSRSDASFFTDADLTRREEFQAMWGQLGPEYRKLITELVLEQAVVGDMPRPYAEIGRELCGYSADQPCRASAVTALKMLAFRLQELMGGKVPVRRTKHA